jgi:hypothetical protein
MVTRSPVINVTVVVPLDLPSPEGAAVAGWTVLSTSPRTATPIPIFPLIRKVKPPQCGVYAVAVKVIGR